MTVRTAILVTPAVALLTAVHPYKPLSIALTDAMLRVLVRERVVSDCFSVVPLKNHFQVGAGLATAVHVNVTAVFSETSNDDVVGPVSTGIAAQKEYGKVKARK